MAICTNCDHDNADHNDLGCKVMPCECPLNGAAKDTQVGGSHYRETPIQPWLVVDAWGLDFYAGSALKYLYRAGRKGPKLEDLKKLRHYVNKMIELEEGER